MINSFIKIRITMKYCTTTYKHLYLFEDLGIIREKLLESGEYSFA